MSNQLVLLVINLLTIGSLTIFIGVVLIVYISCLQELWFGKKKDFMDFSEEEPHRGR